MHCPRKRLCLLFATPLFASCLYLKNRANDALDVFSVDGAVGPGVYAEVRATDVVAVGLGGYTADTGGLHGRFAGTAERGATGLGPVIRGFMGHERDLAPLLADDPSTFDRNLDPPGCQYFLWPGMDQHGHGNLYGEYPESERLLRLADFGATAHLGYIGFRVGFSPGELLDLGLGIFGADIAGDDAFPAQPKPRKPPKDPEPLPPLRFPDGQH
jgi:hypothetical protein